VASFKSAFPFCDWLKPAETAYIEENPKNNNPSRFSPHIYLTIKRASGSKNKNPLFSQGVLSF